MLKVAICDDDRGTQGCLETLLMGLEKTKGYKMEIEIFEDGAEIIKKVTSVQRFDIIFMDIEMKIIDGIKAAEQIRILDKGVQIIYVTCHDNYIRDVFKVAPIGFLSKPVNPEEFEFLFLNAVNYVKNQDTFYRFQYYKSHYKIPIREIIYFHSIIRDLVILCSDNNKYQQRAKLSDVLNQLASCDCEFIRIHRSYLVNRRYIWRYSYDSIYLQNGEELPIGKTYIKQVQLAVSKEYEELKI